MYQHRKKTGSYIDIDIFGESIGIIYSMFVVLTCVHRRTQNWTKNNILFAVCFGFNRFRLISFLSFFLTSFFWFPSFQIIVLHRVNRARKLQRAIKKSRRKKRKKMLKIQRKFCWLSFIFVNVFLALFVYFSWACIESI